MVSHRGVSLPAPFARAEPAQGSAPGRLRGSTSTGRRPHTTRRCSKPSSRAPWPATTRRRSSTTRRSREAWMPGRLVVDTRLRDALRQLAAGGAPLEFPTPTLVDEASYAVEAAVLGEADVVRLQRRLDTLEERLSSIELRLPNRIYRKASCAREARARPVTVRPALLPGVPRRPRRAGRVQRALRR